MCMFRFPDAEFERSFYRDLFGVDPHHAYSRYDPEWLADLSSGTSQVPGEQTSRDHVTGGVIGSRSALAVD